MSRHVQDAVLSLAECQELIFIQQCISVIGYRPHVRSSTIHDIALTEPALLIPLVCVSPTSLTTAKPPPPNTLHDTQYGYCPSHHTCVCAQVRAREKVQEAVEEAMGLQGGLLIEFTALMTWLPGSSIDWHYDANRSAAGSVHCATGPVIYTGGKSGTLIACPVWCDWAGLSWLRGND